MLPGRCYRPSRHPSNSLIIVYPPGLAQLEIVYCQPRTRRACAPCDPWGGVLDCKISAKTCSFWAMSNLRQAAPPKHDHIPRVEVYWTAVTYRSVAIYVSLLLAVVFGTVYLLHPDWYGGVLQRIAKIGTQTNAGAPITQNQARFVNLDGRVEVKKVNSVNWDIADYHTTLDKGDLIRTGTDGAARLTFVDGTTYTVKNDSFVTVEENSIDPDRSTSVAVHISSGAVDLATPTWNSPRSKAEVSFANA